MYEVEIGQTHLPFDSYIYHETMATAPEPVFEQTPKSWTLGELFEYIREKRNKKQFTRFICEEGRGLDDNELEFRIPLIFVFVVKSIYL
jgi:hypothetical protein